MSDASLNRSWFQEGPHKISCSKIKANNTIGTNLIHFTSRNEVKYTIIADISHFQFLEYTLTPKQNLLLETVKSHLHGIYINGINLEEIRSVFSSSQIKLLHQLTKPLLIMHDACDFVPRWIYIPDSMRHSGNCGGSKSLWSSPQRQQSTSCKPVETEVCVLSTLLISKYCPKIETHIPKEKMLKRRRKKVPKEKKSKFET